MSPKRWFLFILHFPGVCQANDIDGADAHITTGWHRHNTTTMDHHAKKPSPAQGNQPNAVKGELPASITLLRLKKHRLKTVWSNSLNPSIFPGMEGDTCLRSADCSEGLCCARHFWSRICKPVLTEGQVCTRHRRKGTHGLELFQRCDCGEGMTCRPEKGERDHTVSRTAARNLHTCQRRWQKHPVRDRTTHRTHTPNKPNKPVTNTDKHFPAFHTPEMLTDMQTPNAKYILSCQSCRRRQRPEGWATIHGKLIHPEECIAATWTACFPPSTDEELAV